MRCERCWFCTRIGAGIYAEFPVKYCKYRKEYILPFVTSFKDGQAVERRLDFNKTEDCRIWHGVGCIIHPSTVKKAKEEFIKRLEGLKDGEERNRDINSDGI